MEAGNHIPVSARAASALYSGAISSAPALIIFFLPTPAQMHSYTT